MDIYSNSLEKLNFEIQQIKKSKEYRLGVKTVGFIEALKSHKLYQYIKKEHVYRKIARFNSNISKSTDYCYGEYPDENLKFVVYTCITGGYDNVIEPLFLHPSIKYILYTDNKELKSRYWEIRYIEEAIQDGNIDNITANRYIKMHPHVLFPEYNYSLYIDGNIRVVSDIRNMINRIDDSCGIAFHLHSSRNCIYNEIEVCKLAGKGNYKKMKAQVSRYKDECFPVNFGMLEANIILVNLNSAVAEEILESWWEEFLISESYRDQISLPYVIWKKGYNIDIIGSLGDSIYSNPKFSKISHNE